MYDLHIVQNPSGTYSFVGTVPVELAWVTEDGKTPSEEQIKLAVKLGPRFAKLRTRTWLTAEEALREAEVLGYAVANAV